MLARLSAVTHVLREWQLRLEDSQSGVVSTLHDYEQNALLSEILSVRFPKPDHTVRRIVSQCQRAVRNIQNKIQEEFDDVAAVLYRLEQAQVIDSGTDETSIPVVTVEVHGTTTNGVSLPSPGIIQGECLPGLQDGQINEEQRTVPVIIVTKCQDKAPFCLSHVPVQNSAFGRQLTVPRHLAINRTFPPMKASPIKLSAVQGWSWQGGHWEANLMSIAEQERRGLCSKIPTKRRKAN